MLNILRLFLSIPLGLIVMGAFVWVVELIGHKYFPVGAEMEAATALMMKQDPSAREAMTAALPSVPLEAFVVLLVAWTAGGLTGGWIAARVTPILKVPAALSIGFLNALFVALNFWMLPHPSWMVIPGLALPIIASFIGGRAAKG